VSLSRTRLILTISPYLTHSKQTVHDKSTDSTQFTSMTFCCKNMLINLYFYILSSNAIFFSFSMKTILHLVSVSICKCEAVPGFILLQEYTSEETDCFILLWNHQHAIQPVTLVHSVNPQHNWLSYGFTSHPTQNRSFWICSSQSVCWLSTEKPILTQQKQTCVHNKIYNNTKWAQQTKARFGRLLLPLAKILEQ